MRPLDPGTKLRAYTLEHRIGRGGEGDVWFARNIRGQAVAIKARPNSDDNDARRFRAEFARLRTLRLPGVVQVLDAGADQGYLFFAMEVAEGVPFNQFMEPLTDTHQRLMAVCRAGAQVARALASIHRIGLAHRDIKPANIHVTGHPTQLTAVVLDFGTHHFGHGRDETGAMRGTPAYMSPEQRLGMPHDHRVDLYSLGAVIYEALMGAATGRVQPGQRCPSLVGAGPHISLPLADLVDRMLDLDPADRPSAEKVEAILRSVADGIELKSPSWPKPVFPEENTANLISGSRLVVGSLGDGVSRYIASARCAWYRKGYTSVMGRCSPARAYGPWRTILSQLFQQRSVKQRAELAASDTAVLHGIWPELPVRCQHPLSSPPDAQAAGLALANVLNRCSPIAVVLHHLDDADPGTQSSLPALMKHLDDKNRLWMTARAPINGLTMASAPAWNADAHIASWTELIGARAPVPPPTETGREFLRSAWAALSQERHLAPIPHPIPTSLCRLSVLREPFPEAVAVQVAPDLNTWVDQGHLVVVSPSTEDASARLRFASGATRLLAASDLNEKAEAHQLAALAWGRFPEEDEAIRARCIHLLYAKSASPKDIAAVIQLEVNRERPHEIRRWLDLQWLHLSDDQADEVKNTFEMRYAQLYAQLYIAPNTIELSDVRELTVEADSALRRGLSAHFKLAHAIRSGRGKVVADEARRWARSLSQSHPILAARMFREIAMADLGTSRNSASISASRNALFLARKGAALPAQDDTTDIETTLPINPKRLTQPEIDAATTYSAALVYDGSPSEALQLCEAMSARCLQAGHSRGAAAFLINGAIAALHKGQRGSAINALAEAATLQHTHGNVSVFANQAVTTARLAVERGDGAASRLLLDEAITAAQSASDPDLLGEAWASALDRATQTGSVMEARHALMAYGESDTWSARDHWPAALARWQWARGKLKNALLATAEPRQGYGGGCVQAEHARLLLLNGNSNAAVAAADSLLRTATRHDWADLVQFAHLVNGAARRVEDAAYQPLVTSSRESRWVHLYLGALHLDAIRRRGRGENVMPQLRRLRARAVDLNHQMYEALANPKGW